MNIAFIIYNRSDLTQQVFNRICQAQPERLFLIADGPKDFADAELCNQTRDSIAEVDWPCDVVRIYSDVNMGTRERVLSGLDTVFSQVNDAIILEDDCLPSPDFFPFCQELLDKYRDDTSVFHISGTSLVPRNTDDQSSYSFSRYPMIWGWATWKRAWREFDREMLAWPNLNNEEWCLKTFPSRRSAFFFNDVFEEVFTLKHKVWGPAWFFSCLVNQRICIVPKVNLIQNVGINPSATRTKRGQSYLSVKALSIEFPLSHPQGYPVDANVDKKLLTRYIVPRDSFPERILGILKNKHIYGLIMRNIPLFGKLWARHRAAHGASSESDKHQ